MARATRCFLFITALALMSACVSVPVAHASRAPFEGVRTGDFALGVLVVTATPVILVGDIALAAQGSWAPLAWSVPEFVVACMWMVVAANDATPKLGMAPPVLAAGMFAHAIASMTLYNEPGVSTHTRSTTPRRPTIRRWQFAPTVARRAVMLSATRAF